MRLIINMGNHDLRVRESGNDNNYLPCNENYSQRVQTVVEALNGNDSLDINEDGRLNSPIYIKVDDDKDHTFTVIDFPILKKEIQKAFELSDERPLNVTVFVTDQEDKSKNNLDTKNLAKILSGIYGKTMFPEVNFEFKVITCNPSDYSAVHNEYSQIFLEQNFGNVMVAIASGTPAMNHALATCSIRYCKNVKQFYSSKTNDGKDTNLFKLNYFSNSEFLVAKEKLINIFEGGDYSAAKILISEPPLSYIEGIDKFIDYFDKRRNYQFKDAYEAYLELIKVNSNTYGLLKKCSESLNKMYYCINSNNKELNISEDESVLVLYESLQNAKFFYLKEQYFTAVAFLNAFLDMMTSYIIGKALDFNLIYNGVWYKDLDSLLEKKVFNNEIVKTNFSKEISLWYKNEGKPEIPFKEKKYLVIRMLSKLPKESININRETLINFGNLYNCQKQFKDFSNIRNSLPIAHSPKSISKKTIENSLSNYCGNNYTISGDNKFLSIIDVFKSILIKSVNGSFDNQFNDYREIGLDILKSLSLNND